MRLVNAAATFLFAAFLLLPALSLMVFGYSSLAENPLRPASLDLGALVGPHKDFRQAVFKRILTDTPVGMAAVAAHSRIDLDVFGAVATPQVISGLDGWLFYRPDFAYDWCDEGALRRDVDHLDALIDLAAGAGVRLIVSVSPDKSSAAPERLGVHGEALARTSCKAAGGKAWRDYAASVGSPIIDHLAALRANEADYPRYYRWDTHWNDYGVALASRQLAIAVLGADPGVPDIARGVASDRKSDLMRMLHVDRLENTRFFFEFWSGPFASAVGPGVSGALIAHDSFYLAAGRALNLLFPGSEMIHIEASQEIWDTALRKDPHVIVVNSVERSVFDRTATVLSWESPLGRWIKARNRQAARRCAFRRLDMSGVETRNLTASPRGYEASSDPQIAVPLDRGLGLPCLRVTFRTDSDAVSTVHLPASHRPDASDGRSVEFRASERQSVEVVLPAAYAGRTVRIDPLRGNGPLFDLAIEVGTTGAD